MTGLDPAIYRRAPLEEMAGSSPAMTLSGKQTMTFKGDRNMTAAANIN